nr:MAG TPA: hypothetical protein [Caudoviricetes sp.]
MKATSPNASPTITEYFKALNNINAVITAPDNVALFLPAYLHIISTPFLFISYLCINITVSKITYELQKYVCPSRFLLSFFNTITKTLRIYVLYLYN